MGKVWGCSDDYLSKCCGLYVYLAMPRLDQCPCMFMGCMDRISLPWVSSCSDFGDWPFSVFRVRLEYVKYLKVVIDPWESPFMLSFLLYILVRWEWPLEYATSKWEITINPSQAEVVLGWEET